MPRATIRIKDWVCRVGERASHFQSITRVRRAIDRRADERMREAHTRAELDQSGRLRGPRGLGADSQMLGSPPEQTHVAQGFGGRDQEQQLGIARKSSDALKKALFDAARQPARVGESEPAREL